MQATETIPSFARANPPPSIFEFEQQGGTLIVTPTCALAEFVFQQIEQGGNQRQLVDWDTVDLALVPHTQT